MRLQSPMSYPVVLIVRVAHAGCQDANSSYHGKCEHQVFVDSLFMGYLLRR